MCVSVRVCVYMCVSVCVCECVCVRADPYRVDMDYMAGGLRDDRANFGLGWGREGRRQCGGTRLQSLLLYRNHISGYIVRCACLMCTEISCQTEVDTADVAAVARNTPTTGTHTAS